MVRIALVVLAVVCFSQFETLNSSCAVAAQTGCAPCYRPSSDPNKKVENKAADVTEITISAHELTLPCEPGFRPARDVKVSESMVVDVSVAAEDPENDVLTHNYTVSGGRIIGTGSNVKWNLSGVYPGSYTITAGVDDGCGLCGKTQVRTVTVTSCRSDIADIECPTIDIAGPRDGRISPGENTFTANVSGGTQGSITYEWTMSNGEILRGQGTPSIVVNLTEESSMILASVTVRIGGIDPRGSCLTERTLTYENGRLKP
jgi:hypothetical protein